MKGNGVAINKGNDYCENVSIPIPPDLQKKLKFYFNDSFWRANVYCAIDAHRISVVKEYLQKPADIGKGIAKTQAIKLLSELDTLIP